ncbi:hypothetical protein [Pontibacter chitinilyticus]|uniref:hypothetical protein n=1 Tax=Pontibacter chitinilyticus TaxID=2674989 RepID=UPI00321BF1DC
MAKARFTRTALGALLLLIAANAFGGGYYGMAGAEGIPTEWLEHSPFRNYFLPSLFLFACVGGACLVAGVAVLRQHPWARKAAFGCSVLLLVWLSLQVAIIGYVSWMQPATAVAASLVSLLTFFIPKP